MSKHASRKALSLKKYLPYVVASGLIFGTFVAANGSTTFSVQNVALNFDTIAPYNSAVAAIRPGAEEVEAATTANVDLADAPGTIDGVTLSDGEFVLVKNQTSASQNGIYVFTAGTPNTLTRPTSANEASELVRGDHIFVKLGTTNAQSGWIQQTVVSTVGTDAINYSRGLTQLDEDGDPDIGDNATPGTSVDYLKVATIGGQQIDARVTYVATNGHYGVSHSSTDGLLDRLDDADSDTGVNRFINTDVEWNTSAQDQDRYAEFKIEFFKDLASTPVPVTLTNLSLSIYDIDNRQFVSLSGADRFYLSSSDSIITASASGGLLRLQAANTNTSGNDSYTRGRASLEFDSVSTITYRLGVLKEDSDSGASYSLDFGPGLPWTGGAQGAAQVNPVLAQASAPAPYTGPIPTSLSVSCVPAGQASTALLTGERLNTITSAEVDGKAVAVSEVTATSVKLALPALTAGTYSVIYNSSSGRLTHQDSLRVCASAAAPVTVSPGQTPFTITKRFTGYRGDRGPVVARDLRAITAFIKANPGLTSVTCTGSTSGIPAKSTDRALATARATNACNIVKRLVPGITTSISTITGKGVGQFHRAVIITGQGTRP
jgi:hypothetical protein